MCRHNTTWYVFCSHVDYRHGFQPCAEAGTKRCRPSIDEKYMADFCPRCKIRISVARSYTNFRRQEEVDDGVRGGEVGGTPTELTNENQDEKPMQKRGKVKKAAKIIVDKGRHCVRGMFEVFSGWCRQG
jgi:hypothetical protein